MKLLPIFLLVLLAGICGGLRAASTVDLATATVVVASQADDERARALHDGLAQVLVKMTGSRAILANPAVAVALAKATSYATEVGYVRTPVPGDATATQTALTARFSASALGEVLRKAEIPTWLNRPEWLVVLVVDAPDGQRFSSRDTDPLVYAAVEQAMARRGVTFQVPLFDLEDQTVLAPADAWALNRDKLGIMAHRYGVSQWLVLRYRDPPEGAWHGFWSLGGEGAPLGRVIVADGLSELVNASVDEAVDQFSPRYARAARAIAANIDLVIDNVGDYHTFGQVTAALSALQVVTRVDVDGIDGDHLALRLTLAGEAQDLVDALARDRHFAAVASSVTPPAATAPASAATADARRHWRWRAAP